MCNAWNHTKDCTCGFGGDGHLGGGWGNYSSVITKEFIDQIVENHKQSVKNEYDSFIIPNAICPICGASVFFYQSPYGGRVFFDELQPPWPKHPCTSKTTEVKLIEYLKNKNKPKRKIKHNWFPVTLHENHLKFFDDYIVIAGTINKRDSTQGFKEYIVKNHDGFKYSNPLFYRETSSVDFEISTFFSDGETIKEIRANGWKREKAIKILPSSTRSLKISVGDEVEALFNGEIKGLFLQVQLKNWTVTKNCFVDKIDISESNKQLIKSNSKVRFEFRGVVTRIKGEEIFIKEIQYH